jgi:hypothetical protein
MAGADIHAPYCTILAVTALGGPACATFICPALYFIALVSEHSPFQL